MDSDIKKVVEQIVNEVSLWDEVTVGVHSFGGKEFLFHGREIGHIHWNGDLDILIGKEITSELLKHELVQQHKYVPKSAITFPVCDEEQIPFALSLLRFSYLIYLKEIWTKNMQSINLVEIELDKISFYPFVKHLT